MPHLQIPEKLLPFQTKKKRFKIVIGGRGSGKSNTIADLCLMDSQVHGLRVGCFREFQNSIDESVYSLLKSEIERLKMGGFSIAASEIHNDSGGEFRFRGLARNAQSIQSMHGFRRFWVEEAQTISAQSLKILTPTIREEGSEIWMSANPMSRADPFSQRFIVPFEKQLLRDGYYEDDLHLIIRMNYHDNPFFPQVLEDERAYAEKTLSSAEYNHIWLGEFNDTIENSIISPEWFDAAIDAHVKLGFEPVGMKMAAHDPSDTGPDAKGYAVRHGSVFTDIQEKVDGDINEGCDWALELAVRDNVDMFVWDGDGMGAALTRNVDKALAGKKIDIMMFRGNDTPDDATLPYESVQSRYVGRQRTNRETFKNRRAQFSIRLADRFYNTYLAVEKRKYVDPDTMISLSSSINCIEQVRAEVCRIPLKNNPSGLIQIMSKEDMKKRPYNLPSPNLFDSMMMTQVIPKQKPVYKHIEYLTEF